MVFEDVIGAFDTLQLVMMVILFAAFLYIINHAVKTLIGMAIIAAASTAFPFAANLLGFALPTDLNAVVFFVALGIGLYLLFIVARIIYGILNIAGKIGGLFLPGGRR
ncbi:MAG: hypothetical protein J4431_02260 [Candidatus Aenigmarchaeota archaeon]|nr:hypothetical protein [Candidatus Aenigmarchaeota archaeon]